MELEREKVALLKDVFGLLLESSERDAQFQKEEIVLKRAKLDLMARQLAFEEERFSQQSLSIELSVKCVINGVNANQF